MPRPTTAEFVYSAGWTYTQGSVTPKNPFLVDGKQLTALDVDAGFFGAAFLTPAGQVIVAFEGTDIDDFSGGPSDRAFAAAQILADIQIYLGQEPPAYAQAIAFTQAVVQAAAKQGITRDNVYVTGHSLGGGLAGYVAAQTGLGAETYGAPGVPKDTIPGNGGPGSSITSNGVIRSAITAHRRTSRAISSTAPTSCGTAPRTISVRSRAPSFSAAPMPCSRRIQP